MNRVGIWAKARVLCLAMTALVIMPKTPLASTKQSVELLGIAAILDRPAMTLPPAELQRAAMGLSVPDGEGVVTMARQASYVFDAQGRATASWHAVVRMVTATGARAFGPLEAEWSPWHEERPRIRARVVSRDGKVHLIDERTMSEHPAYADDPEIHSDRRALRVPLPALQPDAIVEYEIVVAEKQQLFEKGSVRREYFVARSPTGLIRLILEAPNALSLRYVVHGLTTPVKRSQSSAATRLVFERGDLLRNDVKDRPVGHNATVPAQVVFSTGQSWAQVAQAYSSSVDARLAESSLSGLAQQIVGPVQSRKSMAQRLLRYLHTEIRYTAVELGESALLPRSPTATLRRKFGDCKDQATLLVGLLRSLGVPAQVALLHAGVGQDIERSLPGMGLFNHAIVYVPASSDKGPRGGPAMWLDPTLEYGQPDALSFTEQQRLALIASPSATGLLTTPVQPAIENRMLETREVPLSEYGPARIIETTEAWGSAERGLRQKIKQLLDERSLEKGFAKYAERVYLSQGETRVQASDPEDLEAPFRLRIEVPKAKRGYSALSDAVVAIPVEDLTDRLPDDLKELPGAEEPIATQSQRGKPLYRIEPLVHEWRYRISVPLGFRAAPLPKSEVVTLGPGRLSKSFAIEANGVVTAQLRFESGHSSLTPSEVQTMRRAIAELRDSPALMIRFENIGEAHLAAGRYREAFSEFRRLVNLHPKEALHQAQLAMALAESGLGESARQMAAEAVALEPQNEVAQRLHGSVLMYDLAGTFLTPGWDRAGALSALRRAVAMNPGDKLARRYLAMCLERNAASHAYGPGADLAAAITEWRALVKQEPSLTYHEELFAALLHAHRNAELDNAARDIPKGELHDAALVITAAVTHGAEAAVAAAHARIAGRDNQRTALTKAANTIIALRNYALAANLLEEAAVGASNSDALRGQVAVLRRMHHHEKTAALSRPTEVMSQLFAQLYLDDAPDLPQLRALFSPAMSSFVTGEAFSAERHRLRAGERDGSRGPVYQADLLASFFADTASAQGDEHRGYQVETNSRSGKGFTLFVKRQGGRLRVIGQSDFLQSLGFEAMRHADRGELMDAQLLLEWALPFMNRNELAAPLSFEPFSLFVTPGVLENASRIRAAAAALSCSLRDEPVCPEPYRSRALSILTAAREQSGGELRDELALASFFDKMGRHQDVLATVARLRMRSLISPAAEALEALALHKSGRTELARLRLDSMLRDAPKNTTYWRMLAEISQESGDFAAAESCWRKLKELGTSESLVLRNMSWLAVLNRQVTAETEAGARRAVKLTDETDVPSLRVLATVLLENGKPTEALETLHRISEIREGQRATEDLYLTGRLAEHYGEGSAALVAYRRAASETEAGNPAGTQRWLAQKRLAALTKLAARP